MRRPAAFERGAPRVSTPRRTAAIAAASWERGRLLSGQLTQHEVEHAAVTVVLGLGRRIDAQARVEVKLLSARPRHVQRDLGDRLTPVERIEAADVEELRAVEVEVVEVALL